MRDCAREDLFGEAKWKSVEMIFFPHGAVFIVEIGHKHEIDSHWLWTFERSSQFKGKTNLEDIVGWLLETTDVVTCSNLMHFSLRTSSCEMLFVSDFGGSFSLPFEESPRDIVHLLTVHAEAERTLLRNLSYLVALKSDQFLKTSDDLTTISSMLEMDKYRKELAGLARSFVRYRVSMAIDELSCEMPYLRKLRSALGIDELRVELRQKLRDAMSFVESEWIFEQRVNKNKERLWEVDKEDIDKEKKKLKVSRKNLLDVLYGAFAAFALPFIVAGGVWGMNNSDVPTYVPWKWIMVTCGLVGLSIFLLVFFIFRRGRPQLQALSEKQQRLNEARLGGGGGGHALFNGLEEYIQGTAKETNVREEADLPRLSFSFDLQRQ